MSLFLDSHEKHAGGVSHKVRSTTISITAQASDRVILVDATGGARTITLPPIATAYDVGLAVGQVLRIAKIDASGNAVTIDGNASETINGATTLGLAAQWDVAELVATSTGWIALVGA